MAPGSCANFIVSAAELSRCTDTVTLIGSANPAASVLHPRPPVMEATDDEPTSFHIHNLSAGPEGRICLLAPETVTIPGHVACG
jgi:hypothetical protein